MTDTTLRRRLAEERDRTEARIADLRRDFDRLVAEVEIDPPDDEHDPEGAGIAFERQQVAALLSQARSHLAAVGTAEERLAAGALGTCERCGRRIPAERLEARPTSLRCVGCAEE